MGKKSINTAEINDQIRINDIDIAFFVFVIGQLNNLKRELQG
jgi:hypothetical protein